MQKQPHRKFRKPLQSLLKSVPSSADASSKLEPSSRSTDAHRPSMRDCFRAMQFGGDAVQFKQSTGASGDAVQAMPAATLCLHLLCFTGTFPGGHRSGSPFKGRCSKALKKLSILGWNAGHSLPIPKGTIPSGQQQGGQQ